VSWHHGSSTSAVNGPVCRTDSATRKTGEGGSAAFLGDVALVLIDEVRTPGLTLQTVPWRAMLLPTHTLNGSQATCNRNFRHMPRTKLLSNWYQGVLTDHPCLLGELAMQVHLLGEAGRGPALEAGVVSRMKTVAKWPTMAQVPAHW
jgi:hypothetical protein